MTHTAWKNAPHAFTGISSQEFAKRFGKSHAAVLRAVQKLTKSLPQKYAALYFQKCSNTEYSISHEGILLLFGSFTAKNALSAKIAYLEEHEENCLWDIALTREIAYQQGMEYANSFPAQSKGE